MQEAITRLPQNQVLRSAAEGFFRRWRLFTFIWAGTLLLAVIATFTAKKQYRSETKFLLENNRSNAVITSDRNTSSSATPGITEQQLNSELEVLGSEDVIGPVADPEWISLPPTEKTAAVLKRHERRLADFRQHLSFESGRKSNVITVSYTASSPSQATRVLDGFSGAYFAQRKLLSRPSGASSFFTGEASRYQDTWQRANQDLVDFRQQHQIVSVQQAEGALSKQILGYEDDLRSNEASLAEMNMRFTASERAATETPARQQTQEHTVVNRTSTEQMRTLLVQLRNRRTELLTRYAVDDRLVVEVDHQIAETKTSLMEAIAQKAREDTTDINPAWQQIQNSLVEGGIERQALRSKNAAIAQALSLLRARLSKTQGLDVTFNNLEEKADQARGNFELFSEKRDQSLIEDAMDEQKLVNIAVAEKPTSAFSPVSPKPLLNSALGFVTALFLALAVVYFAESGRSTIGSARELEMLSRFPVLATLPCDRVLTEELGEQKSKPVTERNYGTPPLSQMAPAMQNFSKSTKL